MDSSPFDFDVVTGPPPPRDEGKAKPRKDDGEKPDSAAPPTSAAGPSPRE